MLKTDALFCIKTYLLSVFSDLWSSLPLASGISVLIHLPILLSELPKAQHITQIWGLTTIKQKRHRQYSHLYILISCYHKEASHTGGLFKVFDLLLVLISCVQLITNHKTFHLFYWFFSSAYSGKFPNFSRTFRRVCYRRRQKKTK